MSLDWMDETRDLGVVGRAVTRTASVEDRRRVAEALELLACDSLVFDYTIKAIADGRYRIKGRLKADVTQACVVSLDPVAETIAEDVSVDFWPEHLLAERLADGERSILGETDPEPIGPMGRIESGRIAFEFLSAALDPYPRKDGAEFQYGGTPEDIAAEASAHPFAALAKLKRENPAG